MATLIDNPLRDWLNAEACTTLTRLHMLKPDLFGTPVLLPGKHLRFLAGMPVLQELCIMGDYVMDLGSLAQLAQLSRLRSLYLPRTSLPAASLRVLEGLPLEQLILQLPAQFQSVAQLPLGLRAAYLKGKRVIGMVGWSGGLMSENQGPR